MPDNHSVPFRSQYKSRAYHSDASPSTRPKHLKDQTDNLLSYYQSSLANGDTPRSSYTRPLSPEKTPVRSTQHTRQLSSTSTSSSDYSDESEGETDARGFVSEASAGVGKRSNAPTKGGADRRRMAIVQMDSVSEGGHTNESPSGTLRQRRGHQSSLSGLALVAPPDASLRSYTHITPPPTAPPATSATRSSHSSRYDKSHHRSASEIPTSKYGASYDSNTVVTGRSAHSSRTRDISPEDITTKKNNNVKNNHHHHSQSFKSSSPAFQRPSRPPSPSDSIQSNYSFQGILSPPDTALPIRSGLSSAKHSPMLTPGIGEGKDVHVPVAGPVVVNLGSITSNTSSKPVSARSDTTAFLRSDSVTASSDVSSHKNYQTAADTMPPPRAMFNIDTNSPPPPRPPRLHSPAPNRRGDIEAVKQALQLPSLASPSMDSLLPNQASNRSHSQERRLKHGIHEKELSENDSHTTPSSVNHGAKLQSSRSIHRREGAFSPTATDTLSVETASSAASNDTRDLGKLSEEPDRDSKLTPSTTPDNDEVPTMTIIEPAPPPVNSSDLNKDDPVDRSKFDQWLLDNVHLIQQPQEIRRGMSLDEQRAFTTERPTSPLSADHHSHHSDVPSPPPKSFRNSLTTNLKRFSSLPRAPSLSSRSPRGSSGGTRYSSRTPSPSTTHNRHAAPGTHPPFKKIRSTNPSALFCHEVYSQTTTLQRCAIYTAKINELYLHDCGLSDWLVDMNTRGQTTRPRGPSTAPFSPQARHSSRSSMLSEATFPRRPDAYMATDLSQTSTPEINPAIPPATLPYPSLALNPPRNHPARSNSSVGHNTPPSSVRSLVPVSAPVGKTGGFFASLGRRASTSKKDRPVIAFPPNHATTNNIISGPMSAGPGIGRTISKTTISSGISRPLNSHGLSHTPPSGPRAPPNRVQRSQTFMMPVTHTSYAQQRDDALGRRPSLFDLSNDVLDIRPDPEFNKQVDRLMLLLPNADRDVLAGYLRRAGTDMLAIGQYLADEKTGNIRYPHD